jgi:hypothetical protein
VEVIEESYKIISRFAQQKSLVEGVEFDQKPIVLFERHCHATEKSEAIACARRWRSSRLARWWTQKRISRKKWRAKEEERHKG